jgi:hypothetical protein
MDHSKTKLHPDALMVVLTAVALLCCSLGAAKVKKSANSQLSNAIPAVVQVADGVAPSPPPPPPPPRGVVPASQV